MVMGTNEYSLTKEDIGRRLAFVYIPVNFEGKFIYILRVLHFFPLVILTYNFTFVLSIYTLQDRKENLCQ